MCSSDLACKFDALHYTIRKNSGKRKPKALAKGNFEKGAQAERDIKASATSGEMNVSVMCPSTRMLCKWGESEMLVGIPYELIETVASGVEATVMDY